MVLGQRHDFPRGLHIWRRCNYDKCGIFMSFFNTHHDCLNCVKYPGCFLLSTRIADSAYIRCWWIRWITTITVSSTLCPPLKTYFAFMQNTANLAIRQYVVDLYASQFASSVIFIVIKVHVLVIMSKATSEVFSSYQRNRTVPGFREQHQCYSFVLTELWLWRHKEGFHWVRLYLLRKEQNYLFPYLSSNWFSDSKH